MHLGLNEWGRHRETLGPFQEDSFLVAPALPSFPSSSLSRVERDERLKGKSTQVLSGTLTPHLLFALWSLAFLSLGQNQFSAFITLNTYAERCCETQDPPHLLLLGVEIE